MASKDLPDFVSDEQPSSPDASTPVETSAPAPEAQAPAPAEAGQPRGPDGKFAPVAAEPAPVAPAAPEPAAPVAAPPPAPEQTFAPLAALLDEREKRQAAEKRAAELEQWRQQQEAQARRQPIPDPAEDPQGYFAHQEQRRQAEAWGMRLEMSKQFAEIRHGADTTNQAFQWGLERCDSDPHFNAKVQASNDPVGLVVAEWQREQLLSEVKPDEFAAFKAWKAAQAAQPAPMAPQAATPPLAAPALAPAAPPAQPAAPRPSLASAPSASTSAAPIPRDGEATFRQMFGS
jgi:hypothetical protein